MIKHWYSTIVFTRLLCVGHKLLLDTQCLRESDRVRIAILNTGIQIVRDGPRLKERAVTGFKFLPDIPCFRKVRVILDSKFCPTQWFRKERAYNTGFNFLRDTPCFR